MFLKSEDTQYHAWFHHNDADGFIAVAKKMPDGSFLQHHYKPEQLAEKLSEWTGDDVYFSQNTFYKPYRSIDTVRQLRALYVDLDCYLLNYDPDWLLGHLQTTYFGDSVPLPNYIIFSGRGINVIWFIDPVPYKALPLWQAVQYHFTKTLEKAGSDPKASDAARIFRIAGTTNSKSHSTVSVAYLHEVRYKLKDIQADYLPALKTSITKKHRGRPATIQRIYNEYSLFHARREDLLTLCELRNWQMTGLREFTLFLYRYWSCCFCGDPEQALIDTRELNGRFTEPLNEREVVRATKSAETAYLSSEKEYKYKNTTLIEKLVITPEEQQLLKSIISRREKGRREREKDLEKVLKQTRKRVEKHRRTQGAQPQQEKKAMKLSALKKALEANPRASIRTLAELTGFSKSYVQKMLSQMK